MYVPPHKRKVTPPSSSFSSTSPTVPPTTGTSPTLEYPCVLVEGFPSSYTAKDLKDAFYAYAPVKSIKWISNTSAILIFESLALAQDAFEQVKDFKLSPCDMPSLSVEDVPTSSISNVGISLVKKPERSNVVAKRLVAQALGLAIPTNNNDVQERRRREKEEFEKKQKENEKLFFDD